MSIDEIVKYLKLLEKNIEFYEKELKRKDEHIASIKCITKVVNNIDLDLPKPEYTKEEIIDAYNKMLHYEGIDKDRSGTLIIDTFIAFLNGTHHSINKK